jgi:hypothetical protein
MTTTPPGSQGPPAGHPPAHRGRSTPGAGAGPGGARPAGADRQQHHLRSVRRCHGVLALLPQRRRRQGIVPVWGFGNVVQSLHPGVAVGERLYGYWPLANSAVLQPDRLTPTGFRDAAPHRAGLHAIYNQYQRCAVDPFHTADTEGLQALLRPLFTTSWLIDDFLADNGFFGAARSSSPARPARPRTAPRSDCRSAPGSSGRPHVGGQPRLLRRPGLLHARAGLRRTRHAAGRRALRLRRLCRQRAGAPRRARALR